MVRVFTRLEEYGIQINAAKCVLGKETVKFLGYEVSALGTKPPADKIEAIRNFPKPNTARQLRQFLGMVNFYRRFVPGAAQAQAVLNDMLKGKSAKGKTPVEWTTKSEEVFNEVKEDLTQATMLVHPNVEAELRMVTDASDTALGAVIQQREQQDWQPLAFLSKKLNDAQKKYSPYDRELLAIYKAVRHFQHTLEERQFSVLTGHKPLVYAFKQNPLKSSPRQARQLEFISQFITDIQHIAGQENVVAGALSRVEEIMQGINFEDLAKTQRDDAELRTILKGTGGLQLKKVQFPGADEELYCDTSTPLIRPYVTPGFRLKAYQALHSLAHPGVKATAKLVSARYMWPNIGKDCKQ